MMSKRALQSARIKKNWKKYLNEEILNRHFGISHSAKLSDVHFFSNIQIGIPCFLEFIDETKKLNRIFWWFDSLEKGTDILTNPQNLMKIILHAQKESQTDFSLLGSLPFRQIDKIERLPTDATNLQFVILAEQKKYLLKRYTRLSSNTTEFYLGKTLAKHNIFPNIHALLSVHTSSFQQPFLLFSDLISSPQNLDELSGQTYVRMLSGEMPFSSGKSQLMEYVKEAGRTLAQFHRTVQNHPLLPQDRNKLKQSLEDNLKHQLDSLPKGTCPSNQDTLRDWLETFESLPDSHLGIIHADVWWRQFVRSNSTYNILDLEDARFGTYAYDLGAFANSLLQQNRYFRNEFVQTFSNHFETLAEELFLIFLETYQQYSKIILNPEEIDWARQIRALHELCYLLAHFPNREWLKNCLLKEILKWR
ncbi:MAG: phosphotransferase [Candidatus Hodarchaeota archaeon]